MFMSMNAYVYIDICVCNPTMNACLEMLGNASWKLVTVVELQKVEEGIIEDSAVKRCCKSHN